jgi:dienelactone hydrolase
MPPSSKADQPVHIKVTGLRPGSRPVVRLTMRDAGSKLWEASATFRVDARGKLDLDRAAPLSGPYSGRWGMGLFESLDTDSRSPYLFTWKNGARHTFRVGVRVHGRRVAAGAFRRAMPAVHEQPLTLSDAGVVGRFYTPAGPGAARPGILVFGGSAGGQPFAPLPRAFAANGYPTVGLAYFRAPGLPSTLANVPLEYFERALLWLRAQLQVDPNHIIVVGVSRGSEAAQLLGIHYPNLVQAVVAGVPSNVAICSFPDCASSAWTFEGQPVPYTSQFNNPYPTDDPNAVLADELIHGPIFLVCGGMDATWISCPYQRAIQSRLASLGHPYRDEMHFYRRAGHAVGALLPYVVVAPNHTFLNPEDKRAREALWPRLLAFLGR